MTHPTVGGLTAYDSARPRLIPANPPAVFPYSDGKFKWSHKEFPTAEYRYITVNGDPVADIADYEPGCIYGPENLRHWARTRLALNPKHDLTVYCTRDEFATVAATLSKFTWHLFLATLDNTIPGEWAGKHCRAVQYTDRHDAYDKSIVFDTDWLNKP